MCREVKWFIFAVGCTLSRANQRMSTRRLPVVEVQCVDNGNTRHAIGSGCHTTFWKPDVKGVAYVDASATCKIKYYDGRVPSLVNMSERVKVSGDIVKPTVAGTYHIKYTCLPEHGVHNEDSKTRTVVVKTPTEAPTSANVGMMLDKPRRTIWATQCKNNFECGKLATCVAGNCQCSWAMCMLPPAARMQRARAEATIDR
jgi:hypothetical protein